MQTNETRILAVVAGGLNWIISLMAAFSAEDGWLQAGFGWLFCSIRLAS
ncbi:hypothetical protein [Herpetosiphon geysericola]|nr:hypothetical protein [Herpetosiphon geysericola]